MKKAFIPIAICLSLLFACKTNAPKEHPIGGDRDTHGCLPAAGYSWCNTTNQCERPWELAKQEGFDNTQEAFDSFCKN